MHNKTVADHRAGLVSLPCKPSTTSGEQFECLYQLFQRAPLLCVSLYINAISHLLTLRCSIGFTDLSPLEKDCIHLWVNPAYGTRSLCPSGFSYIPPSVRARPHQGRVVLRAPTASLLHRVDIRTLSRVRFRSIRAEAEPHHAQERARKLFDQDSPHMAQQRITHPPPVAGACATI